MAVRSLLHYARGWFAEDLDDLDYIPEQRPSPPLAATVLHEIH